MKHSSAPKKNAPPASRSRSTAKVSRSPAPSKQGTTAPPAPENLLRPAASRSLSLKKDISFAPAIQGTSASSAPKKEKKIHLHPTAARSLSPAKKGASHSPAPIEKAVSRSPVRAKKGISASPARKMDLIHVAPASPSRSPAKTTIKGVSASPAPKKGVIHASRSPSSKKGVSVSPAPKKIPIPPSAARSPSTSKKHISRSRSTAINSASPAPKDLIQVRPAASRSLSPGKKAGSPSDEKTGVSPSLSLGGKGAPRTRSPVVKVPSASPAQKKNMTPAESRSPNKGVSTSPAPVKRLIHVIPAKSRTPSPDNGVSRSPSPEIQGAPIPNVAPADPLPAGPSANVQQHLGPPAIGSKEWQQAQIAQLFKELQVQREPISVTAADLVAYTEENLADDPLVSGMEGKVNPWAEKKRCGLF